MNWLPFTIGMLLVLVAIVDLIWTVLWIEGGAGGLTRRVGDLSWLLIKWVGQRNRRVLTLAGPTVLLLTVTIWVALLWLGWFLIFESEPSAVVSSRTELPADWMGRIYFVGYTLFTLGNGEFQPKDGAWQVATTLATATGLFAVTLSITYLLSVVSAAVSSRALAIQVSGLGRKPADVIAGAWDGTDYSQLNLPLQTLSSQLSQLGQFHLAYPVLRYFHASEADRSPVVALVRLEQVIAIARHALPKGSGPAALLLGSVQSSIDSITELLPERFTGGASEELPAPDLEPLTSANLPTLPDETFALALKDEHDRRKKLRGLLEDDRWSVEELEL